MNKWSDYNYFSFSSNNDQKITRITSMQQYVYKQFFHICSSGD